jgi:hypothetical protein
MLTMYSTSSIFKTHKFDMTILGIYLVLLVAYCTPTVSFTVSSCLGGAKGRLSYTHFAIIDNDEDGKKNTNKMGDDGFVPAEEQSVDYTGSVDWDAEWKKVVKNQDRIARDRPGKDFYKSEAEIAAIVSGVVMRGI